MFMPDFDDVMEIHGDLVEMFRADADPIEPPGTRDEDLVQSACLRPNTSVGDWDKYESLFEKAAALFHSLVQNRAFHNGNKRTALVTLLATLHRNGWILDSSVDDEAVYELTAAVANGGFPGQAGRLDPDASVRQVTDWLEAHVVTLGNAELQGEDESRQRETTVRYMGALKRLAKT